MINARWRLPAPPIPPGRAVPVASKELITAEIARKRTGPRAGNASAPVRGEQTDQRETSAGKESDGGVFCQLDSGDCELVKRLRDPSLSSPLFKRVAEIAVGEPNLLATRLAEAGVEPRLALAIARLDAGAQGPAGMLQGMPRHGCVCLDGASPRAHSRLVLGGAGAAGISGRGSCGCAFSKSQTAREGGGVMADLANPASKLRDLRDSIDNIDAAKGVGTA
jgi:hypothetical protein